jgi:phage terminase small subunit
MALNARQQKFVDEYVIDRNATAAYIRAGYKAKGTVATAAASRLLANVNVSAAIQARLAVLATTNQITAQRVVEEFARIAFSRMRDYAQWGPGGVVLQDSNTLSDDAMAAVAEVSQTVSQGGGSIRFKLHSKTEALKNLGQHLGLFEERKPLEVLLAGLDPRVANEIRHALAELIASRGDQSVGGNGTGGPSVP